MHNHLYLSSLIVSRHQSNSLSSKDCSMFLQQILNFCQVTETAFSKNFRFDSHFDGCTFCLYLFFTEIIFQVLPIGKELLCCLLAFKDLVLCPEGWSALASALHCPNCAVEECRGETECDKNDFHFLNDSEWRNCPPLLCCWTMFYRSVESKDGFLLDTVEAINVLAQSLLRFCTDGKRLVSHLLIYVF